MPARPKKIYMNPLFLPKNIFDANWLRVFRVKEVFPGISAIFIAALDTGIIVSFPKLLSMTIGFMSIFFSAFLINELVDANDTDKFNPEREKGITRYGVSQAFTTLAFIITSLVGLLVLHFINLAWAGVIAFLILFAYSAPFIRVKTIPFVELIFVTVGCALLPYLSYYFLAGVPITWLTILIISFFGLGFPAIQLVNEGADFAADKKAGLTTTAVFLGEKRNLVLIQFLSLFSVFLGLCALALTLHWWYLYILAIVFFLFTAAQFGLTIHKDTRRLHELLRTGEKFGVFVSDLGTVIVLIIFIFYLCLKGWLS